LRRGRASFHRRGPVAGLQQKHGDAKQQRATLLFPCDARMSPAIAGAGRNGVWVHGFRSVGFRTIDRGRRRLELLAAGVMLRK
jgi:hypothetical protein